MSDRSFPEPTWWNGDDPDPFPSVDETEPMMPRTADMRESKFLKQSDVATGMLLTIAGCEKHNVAQEGTEPEYKWCLTFEDSDKPFVLNMTNIQLLERICDSDNTDDWIGKKVVLFTDPTISYGGKVTGGIRVRAPKKNAKPAPPPVVADLSDDDVPFMWLLPFLLPALGLLSASILA